jgi:hypothetical protein
VNVLLKNAGFHTIAAFVPDFMRVPLFMMHFAGYKF